MRKGYKFLSDTGEVLEVTSVFCEIQKPSGEKFTLDTETIQYLLDAKSIRLLEIGEIRR